LTKILRTVAVNKNNRGKPYENKKNFGCDSIAF